MSVNVKNSLSTFLEQALILEQNSLETVSKINDAVTSTSDNVKLILTNPKDPSETISYDIPSFNYLKSAIERLDATINTMNNVNPTSGSRIRLSDGTYRKIITSKVPSEAPTITSVNSITNFNFKSNWFFEDMLNPCLYIDWDLSNQISPDTERIMIQRYILQCDTQTKKDAFNTIKGRNDINYKDFLSMLVKYKIRYSLDDEIKDLPPRSRRYSGDFSVIKIEKEKDSKGNYVKRYTLTSLEYTDNLSTLENTRILSVGDFVEINSNPVSTRFEVIYSSPSENKIGLKLIEGCENIRIGANTLRISSSQDTNVSAEIAVGFDEREVIFIKPIDPNSNIPANKWSPGVAFYTNELTYVDETGYSQTLQRFYEKNVVDFGQVLLSYANDYYPSIREGIIPNAPTLNYDNGTGDFKIVQINNQLRENVDAESFRKLISDKSQLQSEIANIAEQIAKQKEVIQTTNYVSTNEKLKANAALITMINEHNTKVSSYNSIVNTIKSKYDTSATSAPKYRVRGFWDIPDSQYSMSSGEQKIIKFKIRYRYLSNYGNTNREEEFSYLSNGSEVIGRFSNWNEIETKTRERVKTSSGWEWQDINTADPDEVNINQLDIPIQFGEQVEIQIKSVSEAGWPANPMESDWSDAIIVAFSDFPELEANDIKDIIAQNTVDAAVVAVTSVMGNNTEHMSSSFYTNDKYFAHTAESITSGFLSPEQTPITLYDKLQELQTQIDQIIEVIKSKEGELIVNLIDNSDVSKIYTLDEGKTTYINAGNYLEDISKLDESEKNGAIVTKTFYLDISTTSKYGLSLLSKLSGNRMSMCPSTINKDVVDNCIKNITHMNDYGMYDNILEPSDTSSTYYMEKGRYDLVPINLSNSDFLDYQIASPNMYQSAQCRGQFVYSRFRNIGDTFDMYCNTYTESNVNGKKVRYGVYQDNANFLDSEKYYELPGKPSNNNGDFTPFINLDGFVNEYNILSGSNLDYENNDYSKNIESISKIVNRLPKNWNRQPNATRTLSSQNKLMTRLNRINGEHNLVDAIKTTNKLAERLNKKYENGLFTYMIEPKIQSAYGFADLGSLYAIDLDNEDEYDDGQYLTTHKIGYESKDRYAIGEDTCNSYLFLSPINHKDIQVDGDADISKMNISADNSIKVPILYQYRMTDYNGNIFGDSSNKSNTQIVKDTKFANIIGIDIWTEGSTKPYQYDIVVYSTYGSTVVIDTSKSKLSTQLFVDASKNIANSANQMVKQAQSTTVINSNLKNRLDVSTLSTLE